MAVRELRRELGWGLRETARRTGYSPTYLSQVERGEAPATEPLAERLAAASGRPLDDVCRRLRVVPRRVLESASARWLAGEA